MWLIFIEGIIYIRRLLEVLR